MELWPGHESGTYGRTGGRTDGRTGRTGVTLNALPLFFEYAGALKYEKEFIPGPERLTFLFQAKSGKDPKYENQIGKRFCSESFEVMLLSIMCSSEGIK